MASDRVTKWGVWYPAQFCPNNSYATGFAIKYEKSSNGLDNTALNAINLLCSDNNNNNSLVSQIASNWNTRENREEYVSWGDWDREFKKCSNGKRLNQFSLRVEQPKGTGGDDTAANSLRMSCEDMKGDDEFMESNTEGLIDAHGQWSEF